ncbi:hypothetical protein CVT25_007771 [Psilocybe cyanescens]|uniref:Uncharacterized protein n=1 Tax=Psilocybe cyanescens TaxID=93625 RepID=A0A409XHY5_PSICY|nr:hypothetical protein CVT25_007771 [Psilocybe cyanescens]
MISITSSRGSSTSSSRITAPATVSAGASLGVTPTSTVSSASNAGSGPQSTVSGNLPFLSSISQIIIRPSDTESSSPSSSATGDDSGTPTSMGLRNRMANSLSVMLSAALGIWFLLPV